MLEEITNDMLFRGEKENTLIPFRTRLKIAKRPQAMSNVTMILVDRTAALRDGKLEQAAPRQSRHCSWRQGLAYYEGREPAPLRRRRQTDPLKPDPRTADQTPGAQLKETTMSIRVTVWGENVHEQKNKVVADVYPLTMHGTIAEALNREDGITATTVTLQDPDHGLTAAKLAATDVLIWWGHAAHGDVQDDVVERVTEAVWAGMGVIFLHSAHFSKPFKRLMGAPCNLSWREAGERERLWVTSRQHPIARGIPDHFEIEYEEMYGEPFGVPEPLETVFISWFQGGEVFRSGLTYRRGAGNIFYFRPGHETYPTYHQPLVQQVIANGVRWANNPEARLAAPTDAPNTPVGKTLEPVTERGARLHHDGEAGYR